MRFKSSINEEILIARVVPQQTYMFDEALDAGMTILWNTGPTASFKLDNQKVEIEKNCISFLTEFHKVKEIEFTQLHVIQFNRAFYCVETQDQETGCRGILFYSTNTIPKFIIPPDKQKQFDTLWEVMNYEMDESDELKLDMLRSLLKRFLILSLRIYKTQSKDIPSDDSSLAIVREFNYLVSIHYKMLSKVGDYAELLHKSPKTLANTFKKFTDKTPLQIINEHRMREARHQLRYSDLPIQEISDQLNFKDVQAFSNFFKKKEMLAPSLFRAKFAGKT